MSARNKDDDRPLKNPTKAQKQEAIAKYRKAAGNIKAGRGDYSEESDNLIEAQYEGLPKRFLLGWL